MGLYDDLQTDILNAFETDLLDATRTVQVYTTSSVYDINTLQNTNTETEIDVRAVKISDFAGENVDDPSMMDFAEFLVMDADRITANVTFIIDMKLQDGSDQYKITGMNVDPAGASTTLVCRRFG